MPKEKIKRGRRAEKARKKDVQTEQEKDTEFEHLQAINQIDSSTVELFRNEQANINTFFGLLNDEELDYFKQAESTLNINAFADSDEKDAFVASVLEEAKGKELKLATNQICSKLVERLILLADAAQLKSIFDSFSSHFVNLSYHKYASHCVETLLVRSAALIEKEIKEPVNQSNGTDDGKFPTTERMFLRMLNEVKPTITELIDHQYGSHVLRIILLILAGRKLPSSTASHSQLRSKRSKVARKMIDIKDTEEFEQSYLTPESFHDELAFIVSAIYRGFNDDSTKVREACIHKVSSPVMQLVLDCEGIVNNKDRKLWNLVFLNGTTEKDTKEEAFLEFLLSDPIGSHFLEAVIRFEKAKDIERLYKLYMAHRMDKLCKRPSAEYVIDSLLHKLKPGTVKEILDILIANLCYFIEENISFATKIIGISVEKSYRIEDIVSILKDHYAKLGTTDLLESVLQFRISTLGNTRGDWPTIEENKNAQFIQKLFLLSPEFVAQGFDALLTYSSEKLVQIGTHSVYSHVLETLLDPSLDIIKRRKFLNILLEQPKEDSELSNVAKLACNAYGSHVVDRLWTFTIRLNNYKERIAKDLVKFEAQVKASAYGKTVWRNWALDKFVMKRADWTRIAKEQEIEAFGELVSNKHVNKKELDIKDASKDSNSKTNMNSKQTTLNTRKRDISSTTQDSIGQKAKKQRGRKRTKNM